MTEREKIINIVEQNKYCDVNTAANCRECKYSKELENYKDMGCSSLKTADALIAAGFGDVSAVKAEQEEIKLFNAEIKNCEIEMTVGSAGFKTFFALVEQIFKQNGASAFLTTTIEGGNDIKYAVTIQRVGGKSPAEELRQATELWKHEQHRAEVTERAFDNTMKVFHEILSAIFPDTKIDLDEWKKNNLANAEKELAEEKNEEKKRT